MTRAGAITICFLRDLAQDQRLHLERQLKRLGLAEGQDRFTRPAGDVLDLGRDDPTRDTFAVIAQIDSQESVVGIGVLQPFPPTTHDRKCSTVLFRGFSIDPRWQGCGIGTAATKLVMSAAPRRFPSATSLRLTVNVANTTGRHVYERCGFTPTGEQVAGRSGAETVMTYQFPSHHRE